MIRSDALAPVHFLLVSLTPCCSFLLPQEHWPSAINNDARNHCYEAEMTLGPRERHSSVLCACRTAVSAARHRFILYVRRRTEARDIVVSATVLKKKIRLLLVHPTIFCHSDSDPSDGRSMPRQKFITGWVLDLETKNWPRHFAHLYLILQGWSKSAKFGLDFRPRSSLRHHRFKTISYLKYESCLGGADDGLCLLQI